MQKITPAVVKAVWYKELWLKYLSMCEVDYYNNERMRLEYLCNLIYNDLMKPEHEQISLNVVPHFNSQGVTSNTPTFEEIMEYLDKGDVNYGQ